MSVHPMHSSCTTFNSPDLHSLCPFMHIHDRTMQLACSFINARQGKFIYFACCSFIAPVHANIQDGVESFILLLIHCTCSCVYIRQGGFIILPVAYSLHLFMRIYTTGWAHSFCRSFILPIHTYTRQDVSPHVGAGDGNHGQLNSMRVARTCLHVCVYVCVLCACICVCTCICARMRVCCMYVCTHMCVVCVCCVCVCACLCACLCVYMCMCMFGCPAAMISVSLIIVIPDHN